MSVRVTFLGGLGEIGRNCAAIEIEGQIALIDCGLMFPEEDMWGVDLVLPDWRWLVDRREDIRCVVLTHGHEDHMGGLGYFLDEVNVPVFGTRLSLAIAAGRVEEMGIEKDFRPIPDGRWVIEGPFAFQLIPVSHSVPEGSGVVFDTSEGLVVHTGDFKLDPTPVDDRRTDLPTFARFGREGVRLLLSDSTNAERDGVVPSEKSLGPSIRAIVQQAPGRVISTCFSSHLHRVQQLADAGLDSGRYLAFIGRSMERNVRIGTDLGVLHLPEDQVVKIGEAMGLPQEEVMIITTGSQGEPFSALSLVAGGRHRWVKLDQDDTVLISATPVPGNETAVSRVISDLTRSGARVFHGRNAYVHVSGHATAEELKTFLNVVRPTTLVPIHGEYRHLSAHADLAVEMGVPEVLVLEDGDAVILDGEETLVERGAVESRYVYVDGSGVGDIRESLLRERAQLGDDGVVVVSLMFDADSGQLAAHPGLTSHGFMDDAAELLDDVSSAIERAVAADPRRFERDPALAVRQVARKIIKAETGRRPVVLPVICSPGRDRRRRR
ncbi:MAG: ribonuclease J [bacterium]|nr:ribonuclease J [bacterium]MDE0290687.1 ribonuclease J [bacterium]MDE0437240.1 ribonuclease J [bacterium]